MIGRLTLQRPLSFFDLETTGKYPDRDRIVDITIVTVSPEGLRISFSSLVNPGMPIPAGASAIHGITDDMVKDAPTFREITGKIATQLAGSDLAGYNIRRFDVPLLAAEFKRAGATLDLEGRRIVDPQAIFFKREPRDLTAALKFFCGETLEGAHRAAADVGASIAVLIAQLERYGDLPATVDELHEYCKDPSWADETGKLVWSEGTVCISFGKHAGRALQTLATGPDRSYLQWIVGADFPDDTKRIVREALAGRFPEPRAEMARAS